MLPEKLCPQLRSVQSCSHVQPFATPWTACTPGFLVVPKVCEAVNVNSTRWKIASAYEVKDSFSLPQELMICKIFYMCIQSVTPSCLTLCNPTDCSNEASLSITNSQSCSNSCPLNQWCHPTISSSVVPFSSHIQSLPASGSYVASQFFASGGQSIGVSTSASVLPLNIQDWFPLGWLGWISLQAKGLSRVLSNTTAQKYQFFGAQLYSPTCMSMTTGKAIALARWAFLGKVLSPLFNMLSCLFIELLQRRKHLLISWLQSPSAMILQPKKRKSVTVSIVSPSICHEIMRPDAMIFIIWMLSFKPALLTSFTLIKRFFSFSSLSAIRMVSSAYLRLLIFLTAILVPACASSSLAFSMMYSAYMLNKQGDNTQPWRTPFLIWNQSIVSCPVL